MGRNYRWYLLVAIASMCFGSASTLIAGQVSPGQSFITLPDGRELGFRTQGTSNSLSNPGDYDWWYGCSPTSAGMMMGFYDRNGYAGKQYGNLVPGGVAEASTFGAGPYLVNSIIASTGHISDFYGGGYLASGDDKPAPFHSFDSLADFMGTSQDSVGNQNGWTTFWYWTNGSPFTAADAASVGVASKDGMYGIGEYLSYAGYGFNSLFTQHIYSPSTPLGFTFNQYMAEIDAGRPVLIQLDGHTMFGYGYNSANNQISVYDTWSPNGQNPGTMTWGGTYGGMAQWGVEVLEISGGTAVPLPSALGMSAVGFGLLVVRILRRPKA